MVFKETPPLTGLDGRTDRSHITDGAWNPLRRKISAIHEVKDDIVESVTVDKAGSNYKIGNTVTFESSGTISAASAFVSEVDDDGGIVKINVTNGGQYVSSMSFAPGDRPVRKAPTVVIEDGDGAGTIVVTLSKKRKRKREEHNTLDVDKKPDSFYSAGFISRRSDSVSSNREDFGYCDMADETAEQTLFLGASISQFSASAGWNTNSSNVSITLVEDDCCISPLLDSGTGNPIEVTSSNSTLVKSQFAPSNKTDDGQKVSVTDSLGKTVTGYVLDDFLYPNLKVYYNNIQEKKFWVGVDRFNPPPVGHPVHFRYQDFVFNGIIKNWSQEKTTSGTTYKVKIEDPRSVLDGCQLILSNYDGSVFDTPNLINLYGLLEHHGGRCIEHELFGDICFPGMACPSWDFEKDIDCGVDYSGSTNSGFGGSGINKGGITFYYLWLALDYMTNRPKEENYFSQFGGPPVLRERKNDKDVETPIEYLIDLFALTETALFQDYYRVSGDSRTYSDLINRVCQDAALQYLVTMRFIDYYEVEPEDDGKIWGWPDKDLFPQIQIWTYDIFEQPEAPIDIDEYDSITHPPKGCGNESGANTIENRLSQGDVAKTLGPNPEVESLTRGLELRNEPCNYFLVGDNFNPVVQSPASRTIPYWGSFDTTIWADNAPRQTRTTAAPYFTQQGAGAIYWPTKGDLSLFDGAMLPTDSWGIPNLAMYFITVGEVRAAMAGFTQWQQWQYWIGDEARQRSICGFNMPIHYRQAQITRLWNQGIFGQAAMNQFGLERALRSIHTGGAVMNAVGGLLGDIRANPHFAHMVWEHISGLGNEYYGKKWLVRLPDMCLAGEPETLGVRMNWEIMSTGWQDDICIGLPLPELQFFRDEQNKVEAFCQFLPGAIRDGFPTGSRQVFNHQFPAGDYLYDEGTGSLWARGRVDSEPIYNMETGLWYALFELDSSVQDISLGIYTFIDQYMDNFAVALGSVDAAAKQLSFGFGPSLVKPAQVAVPVKSNKISYGPWYSQPFVNGKTRYERDTTFNPWNYNDCEVMSAAGDIKVRTAVTQLQVDESGNVSIPGPPRLNIGDHSGVIAALQQNGPVVTNIAFSVSTTGGIKTSYTMKTYSPSWAGMAKQFLDSLQRRAEGQHKLAAQFRHEMTRALKKFGQYQRPANWGRWGMSPQGVVFDPGSPHHMLFGFIKANPDNDPLVLPFTSDVWKTDMASAMFNIGNESLYTNLCGMSMEGMYRAFGTSGSSGDSFPKMEDIENEYAGSAGLLFKNSDPCPKYFSRSPTPPVRNEDHLPITSITLNPFMDGSTAGDLAYPLSEQGLGHDIEYIIRGGQQPDNISLFIKPTDNMGGWDGTPFTDGDYSDNDYRAVALRGPLMLAGWGYDIYGDPVPSADCKKQFLDNWLRRPDQWKVGPVDLRWDDERKLWSSPPSFQMLHGKIAGPEQGGDCACFIVSESLNASCKITLTNPNPIEIIQDKDCAEALDGSCLGDDKTVVAFNVTKKPITLGTEVVVYFDTANLRYYIISAPEPIFLGKIKPGTGVNGACGTIPGIYKTVVLDTIGGQNSAGGCDIDLVNDLDQPICDNQIVYIWLKTQKQARILQAQFNAVDVVVCVDCYDLNGVPTLEICDRRIYLESAWCDMDCENDDATVTDDTCGYGGGNWDC